MSFKFLMQSAFCDEEDDVDVVEEVLDTEEEDVEEVSDDDEELLGFLRGLYL